MRIVVHHQVCFQRKIKNDRAFLNLSYMLLKKLIIYVLPKKGLVKSLSHHPMK